jgi:hypothetical protein
MPSAVEVVNLALSRIGQGAPISSLDEASEPAVQASAALPFVIEDVLCAYAWPFAIRRASLALVSGAISDPWTYAYRLPTECVRAIELPYIGIPGRRGAPFDIEGDDSGRLVLTNLEDATLRYVGRVSNLGAWPSIVSGVLAWRLAAELATTIARNAGQSDACMIKYGKALSEAVAWCAGESQPYPDALPESIQARA